MRPDSQSTWYRADAFKIGMIVTIVGAICSAVLGWMLTRASGGISPSTTTVATNLVTTSTTVTTTASTIAPSTSTQTPTSDPATPISGGASPAGPTEAFLSEMRPLGNFIISGGGSASVKGNLYQRSVLISCRNGDGPRFVEYYIGEGGWQEFSATVGIDANSVSWTEVQATFELYGDDNRLLYRTDHPLRLNEAALVRRSVKGVTILKLQAICTKRLRGGVSYGYSASGAFGDAKLTR